jgi:hypothetical protein
MDGWIMKVRGDRTTANVRPMAQQGYRQNRIVALHITTTSPLRSRWNIGHQQLSVAEVSVAFKFFIETGLLALCSNPQPGGPGLHIYIPWILGGLVIFKFIFIASNFRHVCLLFCPKHGFKIN